MSSIWAEFSYISFSPFSLLLLEASRGEWRRLPKRLTSRKGHNQIFDEVSVDFPVVAGGFHGFRVPPAIRHWPNGMLS
jgi:hypothetical protein